VLCSTMVFLPPRKISLVYSSRARLLSPTYGTYLRAKCKKHPASQRIDTACECDLTPKS
jgi:hypothetical protein